MELYNNGDEHFSYMTDADGQLVVQDNEGRMRYVTESDGVYSLGGYVTTAANTRLAGGVNVNPRNGADGLKTNS